MKRRKQDRIKKITLYVDACELYDNPNDLEEDSLKNIIKALQKFFILDYDIESISKDEADTFELE